MKDGSLKLVPGAESLILSAVNGYGTLRNITFKTKKVGSRKFEKENYGIAKPESVVRLYEQKKDMTFAQMFALFGVEIETLIFTPAQIKEFCNKHRMLLCNESCELFCLCKIGDKYFVTSTNVIVDNEGTHIFSLDEKFVWESKYLNYVMVPKMEFITKAP